MGRQDSKIKAQILFSLKSPQWGCLKAFSGISRWVGVCCTVAWLQAGITELSHTYWFQMFFWICKKKSSFESSQSFSFSLSGLVPEEEKFHRFCSNFFMVPSCMAVFVSFWASNILTRFPWVQKLQMESSVFHGGLSPASGFSGINGHKMPTYMSLFLPEVSNDLGWRIVTFILWPVQFPLEFSKVLAQILGLQWTRDTYFEVSGQFYFWESNLHCFWQYICHD